MGQNAHIGTLRHNLAIGAVVPAAQSRITNPGGVIIENKPYGAICGENAGGTLENNYYYACTVANVANATGVGSGIVNGNGTTTTRDVTDNDGAVPGIVLYDNSSRTDLNSYILTTVGNADVPRVQLVGRTLTKNGEWNTLCLPFDVTLADSPLAGAEARTLSSATLSEGMLTLNFSEPVSTLTAGTPYLIKWASGDPIESPEFTGVTIKSTEPTPVNFTGGSFVGQYSPFTIDDSNKDDIILLSTGNKLGYSQNARTLRSFRCHFEVPALANAPAMNNFAISFDNETAGIVEMRNEELDFAMPHSDHGQRMRNAWYTLDGRRLGGKPTKAGLYIHGNKKVMIK